MEGWSYGKQLLEPATEKGSKGICVGLSSRGAFSTKECSSGFPWTCLQVQWGPTARRWWWAVGKSLAKITRAHCTHVPLSLVKLEAEMTPKRRSSTNHLKFSTISSKTPSLLLRRWWWWQLLPLRQFGKI
jgi:hypothetical protein